MRSSVRADKHGVWGVGRGGLRRLLGLVNGKAGRGRKEAREY